MNGIYGMELQYESLVPISHPKDTFLSVGAVTFLIKGKELPLDFNITESSMEGNAGSIIRINALIKEYEPQVYMEDYRKLGLVPSALNYGFFAARYSDTCLAEVYTEYFYIQGKAYLPLTLKSACLLFEDGRVLDYSSCISVCLHKNSSRR